MWGAFSESHAGTAVTKVKLNNTILNNPFQSVPQSVKFPTSNPCRKKKKINCMYTPTVITKLKICEAVFSCQWHFSNVNNETKRVNIHMLDCNIVPNGWNPHEILTLRSMRPRGRKHNNEKKYPAVMSKDSPPSWLKGHMIHFVYNLLYSSTQPREMGKLEVLLIFLQNLLKTRQLLVRYPQLQQCSNW